MPAGLKMVKGFDSSNFVGAPASTNEFQQRGKLMGDPAIAAQRDQLQQLQRQANGQGPSSVAGQLRSQANRNMSDSFAQAAMGRGGNQAGMQQGAMGSATATQADTNNQAANARLAEQMQAQAMAQQQAQNMVQNQFGYEQLGQQGMLANKEMDLNWQLGKGQLDLEKQKYHTDRNMGWAKMGTDIFGNLMKGISGISDERAKVDVKSVGTEPEQTSLSLKKPLEEEDTDGQKFGKAFGQSMSQNQDDYFKPNYVRVSNYQVSDERAKMQPTHASSPVREVEGIEFSYKPGFGEDGTPRYGVSAQQLERTSLGPSLVEQGPDGLKRVDIGGAAMAALAGSGDNARRLDELERRLGGGDRLSDERTKQVYSRDEAYKGDPRDPGMRHFNESPPAGDLSTHVERDRVNGDPMSVGRQSYAERERGLDRIERRGLTAPSLRDQQSFGSGSSPTRAYDDRAGLPSMEERVATKKYDRDNHGGWSGMERRQVVSVDPFAPMTPSQFSSAATLGSRRSVDPFDESGGRNVTVSSEGPSIAERGPSRGQRRSASPSAGSQGGMRPVSWQPGEVPPGPARSDTQVPLDERMRVDRGMTMRPRSGTEHDPVLRMSSESERRADRMLEAQLREQRQRAERTAMNPPAGMSRDRPSKARPKKLSKHEREQEKYGASFDPRDAATLSIRREADAMQAMEREQQRLFEEQDRREELDRQDIARQTFDYVLRGQRRFQDALYGTGEQI